MHLSGGDAEIEFGWEINTEARIGSHTKYLDPYPRQERDKFLHSAFNPRLSLMASGAPSFSCGLLLPPHICLGVDRFHLSHNEAKLKGLSEPGEGESTGSV